jgi:hypothetical protein
MMRHGFDENPRFARRAPCRGREIPNARRSAGSARMFGKASLQPVVTSASKLQRVRYFETAAKRHGSSTSLRSAAVIAAARYAAGLTASSLQVSRIEIGLFEVKTFYPATIGRHEHDASRELDAPGG